MANSKSCICCGANLDFGERCDCLFGKESGSGRENEKYYRVFPKLTDEEKIEILHKLRESIK